MVYYGFYIRTEKKSNDVYAAAAPGTRKPLPENALSGRVLKRRSCPKDKSLRSSRAGWYQHIFEHQLNTCIAKSVHKKHNNID